MARKTPERPWQYTADTVRAELARRRMSGRDLVSLLDISERTVRRRLSADTAFTARELAVLADALGISVTDLLPSERAA